MAGGIYTTEDLTEDGELRESASQHPSICLAIPALMHCWDQYQTP